jgi:hypothetical protein
MDSRCYPCHAESNVSDRLLCCTLQVTRESSGDGNGAAVAPQIRIPPPRPKRKPTHPYPRKLGNSPGNDAPSLKQLDKPQLQVLPSWYEQEKGSPKSVLTRAQVGSEALATDNVGSPVSSVDAEDSCPTPRIAAVEVATQLPPYKVYYLQILWLAKHVVLSVFQNHIRYL